MKKVSERDYKKTIQYLYQLRDIDQVINRKQALIDSLRASLYGHGLQTDRDKIQITPRDNMADTCAKIADFEIEIDREIDRLVDKKIEIIRIIDQSIDDLKCRNVIYDLFVQMKTVQECACDIGISQSFVYKLKSDGIRQIAIVLKNDKN